MPGRQLTRAEIADLAERLQTLLTIINSGEMSASTRNPKKTRVTQGVVAYLRVSTEEQADSGAGLAAQEAAIRAECERRGLPLLVLHTDAGLSAKSLEPPGHDSFPRRSRRRSWRRPDGCQARPAYPLSPRRQWADAAIREVGLGWWRSTLPLTRRRLQAEPWHKSCRCSWSLSEARSVNGPRRRWQ